MNSIYDKASNDSMIARINKLTPESKALWGKMNAAQMCRHCAIAIDIAFGKGDLKVTFLMKLLGKMLKKKVFYGGEMGKNSPTAKEFIITEDLDLQKTKAELITNFSRFASEGKSVIKTMNHPFWGKMTYEDWDALMWKHTDHHLKQFGV
ncbi:DUF1569 domain-containing protein [Flavobacterium sp.]|uniref:DUF1569 domain-containing protein n=1 Tax=Flavobacterium sp. TaxID=239 RepID=UPI0035B03CAD